MRNTVKTKLPDLLSQAAGLAQGADDFGAVVNLGPNTGANIRLDISALNAAIAAHGLGKDELTSRRLIVEGLENECRLFLMAARDSMKPTLGYSHSAAWDTVGLVDSLYIPQRKSRQLPTLSAFQAYLLNHPALEDADKGVTAARAGELYTDLDDAIGEVNQQVTVVGNLIKARDDKAKKLRSRIRATIAAIAQDVDPMDMLWESFGLNRPGLKARPDKPEGLTATLIAPNTLSAKWNRTPRAEYYRVLRRIVGVDTEFVSAGNSSALNFLLEDLPANSMVEIMISAVNNGGESLFSEVLTVAIP